jgi:hypothetical protein
MTHHTSQQRDDGKTFLPKASASLTNGDMIVVESLNLQPDFVIVIS